MHIFCDHYLSQPLSSLMSLAKFSIDLMLSPAELRIAAPVIYAISRQFSQSFDNFRKLTTLIATVSQWSFT